MFQLLVARQGLARTVPFIHIFFPLSLTQACWYVTNRIPGATVICDQILHKKEM